MKYLCDKRKIKCVFLALLLGLLFSSCASTFGRDVLSEEAHQRAIGAGIIGRVDMQPGAQTRRNLVEVRYGDIINSEGSVQISFDTSQIRPLFFERDEVRLLEVFVSSNQYVEKGDVLAMGSFDTRELESQIEILQLAIEREEQAFLRDQDQHEDILWEMRVTRDRMTDAFEWETQNYRIQRQEILYANFIRQQEHRLEQYHEELAELYELQEGEKILAPFDGIIIIGREFDSGTVIRNYESVVGIIAPDRFQFVVTGNIDLVRYGDRFPAEITNPSFEFEVQVVSDPITMDTREDVYTFVLQPVDWEAFWDRIAELGVEYSAFRNLRINGHPIRHEIHNVLTIPRAALREHDDEVYVLLYEDGEVKMRFVDAGLRDGTNVQILSGLQEGQQVVR